MNQQERFVDMGPNVIFIQSLTDFFKEINHLLERKPLLWFRGQANSSFSLSPSLYRKFDFSSRQDKVFWDEIISQENHYLNDFKIRNFHLIDRLPENNLTWMSIMQHYGTPTRLLDWTENAFSAFFFALEDYFSQEKKDTRILPCVWCLEPKKINNNANEDYNLQIDMDCLPDMFSLLNKKNENTSIYLIEKSAQEKNIIEQCWPLAIIAPYNNERIKAQSGVFTLFPLLPDKKVNNLNSLALENQSKSNEYLTHFIILKPKRISQELRLCGLKRSMFYPEMPNISVDIEQELNLNHL